MGEGNLRLDNKLENSLICMYVQSYRLIVGIRDLFLLNDINKLGITMPVI